ncbi:MAG TPA: twin-arginine translocase TatA/TatE family subunit [Candidatus Acidoferrales bacterium]|nr:twin-arginine translocase TatA/TatE family subunit [Candidatus Acidoferrales bacterium]
MLSVSHLIIIFVVALVVFGPEKLPELARNLGKVVGEFRRATGDLRSTFEGHLRDLERESEERRIAGPPVAPSPALPELPPLPPAQGTVPTTPSHAVTPEPAGDADPSQYASSHESDAPQNAAPAELPPSSPFENEHNPETLTDAGLPSA